MTNTNLFEVASREQYRFQYKGLLSVEDLWQLSTSSLDTIFKILNSQVKQIKEESLLDDKTKEDEELNNKIEIVKHIVKVKLEEAKAQSKAKENKEQKQKIMEILSNKENEELLNKSPEELKEILANL